VALSSPCTEIAPAESASLTALRGRQLDPEASRRAPAACGRARDRDVALHRRFISRITDSRAAPDLLPVSRHRVSRAPQDPVRGCSRISGVCHPLDPP